MVKLCWSAALLLVAAARETPLHSSLAKARISTFEESRKQDSRPSQKEKAPVAEFSVFGRRLDDGSVCEAAFLECSGNVASCFPCLNEVLDTEIDDEAVPSNAADFTCRQTGVTQTHALGREIDRYIYI